MPIPNVNELSALTHRVLTPMADERKAPNAAVKNLLFRTEITHDARQVQLSSMKRDRKTVPFVRRDTAALVVKHGNDERFALEPAHIRIKEFVSAADLATRRSVDQPADDVTRAMMEATAARVLGTRQEEMMWDIFDTEEWMCCQLLTGNLQYQSEDAAFEVDLGRDAAHDITVANVWDGVSADPQVDLMAAMELTNEAEGLNPTIAICGSEAGKAFLKWAKANPNAILRDPSRVNTGTVEGLVQTIGADGMIYLGTTFHGIAVYMYLRKVNIDGVATDLIRPKYVEVICQDAYAGFAMHYGGIEDKNLFQGQPAAAKRFSKTMEREDPYGHWLLVETNPLPFIRRADCTVSLKVVA